MNNFRFTKIIASVGPTLAKETVLSKIINMVDAFTITLSYGFDDNNKKYIDTLMKLDNSKTIIIETKGNEIRVKNTTDITIKKGQKITVDYSEYTQDSDKKVYIDYAHLDKLPIGATITFEQSQITLKIEKKKEDFAECVVVEAGSKAILQYDRVTLEHNEEEISTLLEKDKKDILWGLEYGAHIVALSACYNAKHLEEAKAFLKEQHNADMKVFAKIETQHGLDKINEIAKTADGIILIADLLQPLLEKKTLEQLINEVRIKGVPVLVSYITKQGHKDYPLSQESTVKELCSIGVDGIKLETMIVEDDVFDTINTLELQAEKYELALATKELQRFDEAEFEVRDYIIYNAYRITQELDVKAIVCFTESGYTSARIASLNPKVPVITFAKSNPTYRFLNLIR
jgi:pyruvate kinase